jgi:hypothetical protein
MGWPTRHWYGDVDRLVGAVVVGVLVLVVVVALVVGRGSPPTGAAAPVVAGRDGSPDANSPQAPTSPGAAASIPTTAAPTTAAPTTAAQWYAGTATLRDQLDASGKLVRRHVDAKDGVSLEPECAKLSTLVDDARAHPVSPDTATARLWSDGVSFYAAAATACGQLFDGTPIEVQVLLDRTTSALDDAERAWRDLDASVSSPQR